MTAYSADAFVDSVGVCAHWAYLDLYYHSGFTDVLAKMSAAKIRHYRNNINGVGVFDWSNKISTLDAAGIKGLFVVDYGTTGATMDTARGVIGSAQELWEGPNEYDVAGGASWDSNLREYLPTIYTNKASFPVVGPSMAFSNNNTTLGNVSSYIDYACVHAYFGAYHPETTTGFDGLGYGTLDYHITYAGVQGPGKPYIATEGGYFTDSTVSGYAPESVAAVYVPRLLLEAYRRGFSRFYLYEMVDYKTAGISAISGYGLLTDAGNEKKTYNALKSLLTLLNDPGVTYTPTDLSYTLTGGDSDVRQMLFQKRNGTYYLAVWIASPIVDANTLAPITVPAQFLTLTLPYAFLTVTHIWQSDGRRAATQPTVAKTVPVTARDTLQIIELASTSTLDGGVCFR